MRTHTSLFSHRLRTCASWLGVAAVLLLLVATLAACVDLSSGNTGNTAASGITVNVKVAHGQDNATLVILPVTINGQGPFAFALDTGASTSLIDAPLAQQLNLPPNGLPTPIAGVSGKEVAVPVQVNSWSVEKLKLPKMTVESANLFASQRGSGLQGLIGSDIWNRFGKFTLNYNSGTLTVPKQIAEMNQHAPLAVLYPPNTSALVPTPSRVSPAA